MGTPQRILNRPNYSVLKRIHSLMLTVRFNCFFFFFFGYLCIAQQETLVEIINSDEKKEAIQQKIDSFFNIHEKKMPPKILADCYHDLGNKWYHEQWWNTGEDSDIENAIHYTQKALEIKLELKDLEEGSIEQTSYNLGGFYELSGNLYSALKSFFFIVEKGRDEEMIQDAKLEIGRIFIEIGDFYKAINQFEEVITFYKSEKSKEHGTTNLVDALIFKAETYSLLGIKQFSDEIQLCLTEADSILQNSDEGNDYFKYRVNQTQGNRLLEVGEYDSAINFHQRVLSDSVNLYPHELARVHNSIAFSQLKLKKIDEALHHLKKAISMDDDYSLPYENLGDLYIDQKDFKQALFNYQKAISWIVDKNKAIEFDELVPIQELELGTDKIFMLNHIITKANGWLKYYEYDDNKNHLTHALETFALADQLVDIIRAESTEYQSKLFWREKGASLYSKAVEVCYLLDKPEEAYYFMERNKALLLLEDISSEQAKEIAKLPEAMVEREFELKRAIFLSENEFKNFETTSSDSLESVKRKVYDHKQIYNTFVDSLVKAFPEYASIKKKIDVLPYPDFKTTFISEDEVVLQYILNDKQGYGLLTANDETEFFKLDEVENLNEKIVSLYGQLTDLATNREKLTAYNSLSHQVFKQLIPEKVHEKIKGKKLLLVTDYILQQIPFEAFVTASDMDNYLIEEAEIRYAYSMSYLEAKKQVANNPEKELFALAPVQFASLGLPELLFSSAEVGEAEKIFSGEVALNGKATKDRFLQNIDNTKILHLSTHADVGEGADPWIAFSDKRMFLNEIYATKNQAEMVVLSACNTSVGELKKGEGAMSLARGFFHSGAKSVVSSLWSTNDKSSKELMVSFYKGLDKGLTKSAAMRKAKIDYINTYRGSGISPAYWSALIVIGDNSPISSSGFLASYWFWAVLGILVLSALYFLNKKIKVIS